MVNPSSNANMKCPKYHPRVQQMCTRSMQSFTPSLTPNLHEAEELVHGTIYSFTREPELLTEQQINARSSIQRLIANIDYGYDHAWPKTSTLHAYLNAFDDFFFFGAMKAYIKIEVTGIEHAPEPDIVGRTSYDLIKGPPYVLIWIADHMYLRKDANHRRNEVLGTLLHEMAYALFLMYGCQGAACCTGQALEETSGFTGHGPSWKRLLEALGKTMQRYHQELPAFRLALDQDIENSVSLERQARLGLLELL